ncbi:MAG: tripartite tricarboxylate transporter substrate binding protein [Sphaerochaetaceae bacterium]|nr:tripartite tricarboxylate transporter substrate binding protein [Sphaerochaetaceae bacterium]
MKKFLLIALVAALVLPLFANGSQESASSAGFAPTKDITWYCTSKPGGGSDIYTRAISDAATANGWLSKAPLVNYKTDGAGEIGRNEVANTKQNADYTLLTFNSGDLMPMVANTNNRIKNFTPIAIMATDKQLLFVNPEKAKYKTFADAIAAAKAGTQVVIAGSKGDDLELYGMLIKELGLKENQMAYITNDSTADAITSGLGGHVDFVMSKPAAASEYVKANMLVPVLALSTSRFAGNLSSAPTLSEVDSKYNNVELPVWRGVVGPANMSEDAAKFYSDMLKKVSESKEWKEGYLASYSLESSYMDYQEAKAYMEKYEADYLKKIGK